MSAKHELQKALELVYNKDNIHHLLDGQKDNLLKIPREYVKQWLAQPFDFAARPDLIEVVSAVHQLDGDRIMWSLLTSVLLDTDASLQKLLGFFWNAIGEYVEMPYRRGHVFSVYLEAVCASGLVQTKSMGKYIHLVSAISVGDRGQRNYGYVLPSVCKHSFRDNAHSAYSSMHVLTGGRLKQHDMNVCPDHIQRLNDIAYKVEERIFDMTRPVFDDSPKFKETLGRYETEEEVQDRYKDFQRFERELPTRVKVMLDNGNEFYFGHRYDVRLRTYLKAYHFDFIGNKYCRAFVQPVKGEVATGTEDYV